jgi:hypothetical protein
MIFIFYGNLLSQAHYFFIIKKKQFFVIQNVKEKKNINKEMVFLI